MGHERGSFHKISENMISNKGNQDLLGAEVDADQRLVGLLDLGLDGGARRRR